MKSYRTYRLIYNGITTEVSFATTRVSENRRTFSSLRTTPTGKMYRQEIGTPKKTWTFSFGYTMKEVYDFFNNAFENQSGGVILEEEQGDGSFISYEVLVGAPQKSTETIGVDDSESIDRGLSCEVVHS